MTVEMSPRHVFVLILFIFPMAFQHLHLHCHFPDKIQLEWLHKLTKGLASGPWKMKQWVVYRRHLGGLSSVPCKCFKVMKVFPKLSLVSENIRGTRELLSENRSGAQLQLTQTTVSPHFSTLVFILSILANPDLFLHHLGLMKSFLVFFFVFIFCFSKLHLTPISLGLASQFHPRPVWVDRPPLS